MCQRKIIGLGVFKIVPVNPGPTGCQCPTITQIRDLDAPQAERPTLDLPIAPTKVTYLCRDIKTVFEMNSYPVTFRFCKCPLIGGVQFPCKNLPHSTLVSARFAGVDLSREFWTENGQGLIFERGFAQDLDADDENPNGDLLNFS